MRSRLCSVDKARSGSFSLADNFHAGVYAIKFFDQVSEISLFFLSDKKVFELIAEFLV